MSPAFFFVQQVEAWQFEAFFALVIITNSIFIGVAQLQQKRLEPVRTDDTWWGWMAWMAWMGWRLAGADLPR